LFNKRAAEPSSRPFAGAEAGGQCAKVACPASRAGALIRVSLCICAEDRPRGRVIRKPKRDPNPGRCANPFSVPDILGERSRQPLQEALPVPFFSRSDSRSRRAHFQPRCQPSCWSAMRKMFTPALYVPSAALVAFWQMWRPSSSRGQVRSAHMHGLTPTTPPPGGRSSRRAIAAGAH
jgi:hypothetical protein